LTVKKVLTDKDVCNTMRIMKSYPFRTVRYKRALAKFNLWLAY